MTQQGLDLAYQNFLQKQQYPYDVLGQYQSTLYGYPYQAYQTTSGFSKPSSFQNLMGVIGAGKSLFPSFGFKDGGHIAFRSSGGLSGLTASYEDGTGDTTVGSKGMKGLKDNLTANLLGSLNLGKMSDSLSRLQELRTKISEAKAKKAAEQDTFMGRLGTFAQGVAGSFDPTKPQSLAGSLAGGIKAVDEANLQDPELVKAQAEAEGIEGDIKTQQAMAELSKDYIKAISDLSKDIESKDFNAIKSAVYNSFGYTIGPDNKLRGFGGKALLAKDQLIVDKALADALIKFKSGGYTAVTEFLAKPKKTSTLGKSQTIINDPNIKKEIEKAQGGQ